MTANPHQPKRVDNTLRCSAPDCYFFLTSPVAAWFDDAQMYARAENKFRVLHAAQYDPDREPDIEVSYELVADCSICEDGGEVETTSTDTIECAKCGTVWDADGENGERNQ